jgi:hypothetical protein
MVVERLAQLAGGAVVVGERAGALVETIRGRLLDRRGDPPVDGRLPRRRELPVDRLAKERVREAEPSHRLRGLDKDVRVDRLLDEIDETIAWVLEHALQHVELEVAAGDGSHREDLAAVIA